ncbi:MAG TPA: serine/threonine-protein kinase, partial [Gemmatales bacterium]|nr:serine/threonine-protein kinase [Gemmatales bacterium]
MVNTTVNWGDQSHAMHEILFRFENAFRAGENPDVNDFLQGEGLSRWRLLTELLHSDLELRLRAGQNMQVMQYLERFPELSSLPNELAALVATEIRILNQLGQPVQQLKYVAEYGSLLGARIKNIFQAVGMALPDISGYELLSVVGQGGMGQVYRARHLQLQRDVAIKVIRADKISSELDANRYRSRFRKEATSVAGVNHPNVVQIYEIGERDGLLFLSMECVEGNSLQKRIDSEGVLSPKLAAEMFIKIASGAAAVHQQQIIHRDLKPDNILLTT